MPLDQLIIRQNHGNPNRKIPFVIAMVDISNNVLALPFPDNVTADKDDKIFGIELMINPASLSTNLSKIVNRTPTMTGFFEEHWGEELDTITFQGMTAAFVTGGNDIYAVRNSLSETSPVKQYLQKTKNNAQVEGVIGSTSDRELGLTTANRRKSVSYTHFKRFVDIVRINGCVYDSFGFISKRYYILLSYGNSSFRGYFESIDVTESAANPFRFQYTITFKSEETIYSYSNTQTVGS